MPGHPIFYNIPLDPNNQLSIVAGCLPDDSNTGAISGQTFLRTTSAGNGNIIAKIGDGTDYVWIAEWPKNETIPYYPGGTYSPVGSKRMVFSAGLQDQGTTRIAQEALKLNNTGKALNNHR